MKGVIFNIVEDVINEHLGEAVWDGLLDDVDVDHGYTALATYADAELDALVAAAAAALDQSRRDILAWVGERSIPYFYSRYPQYFDNQGCTRAFMHSLNAIIHPEVRKVDAQARPPDFVCTAADDKHVTIVYASHRPLCGLAEGMMRGLGAHYREALTVAHPECTERGATRCEFRLRYE